MSVDAGGARSRLRQMRGWLLAGALAIAIALGTLYALDAYHARPGGLTLYGNIDIREVDLGFRVAGRVAALMVDEGDRVQAGQVLGQLDPDPYQRDLREARAQAQAAEARLELLRSGYRAEDIAQARATLIDRTATLADAEQVYARQSQLHGTGAVPERSYDDALAARDEARARVQVAAQALAEMQRGFRREEVAEADAGHERAEAAAAQAQLRLEDTTLRAPAGGVVLTRAAEPGAILAAGATVFTVSLSQPVWARVFVSERDLGRIAPGQSVLIYTDGRPHRPYHGRVGYVSPTAEFTPKNVETTELRTALVYRARVIVEDPDAALLQGMPVTVRVAPLAVPTG